MSKTFILKISTVLGLIPAIIGVIYVFPIWIGDALLEIGYKQVYLLWVFISMYIMVIPYVYSLYLTFRLLIQIDQKKYYTEPGRKYLKHIGYSGYIIGTVFFLDLPFVYGFADEMDAPGIILVFGFLMILAFAIGTFSMVLKELNEQQS
ncbi:DUF2975 domain-containing protein [Paracholeplasma manati]|uniref:DUF2975 domain-containing protein n=1 Tax=Paracholeplasma manati TaxID=591373 RepID=UPI002408627C|nr:DUF2975 domain-containing protein [Paracholeplasma manati]MDG0889004.1 DUF2975 domain-containing protein [Paracholeplasma manati]